MGCVMSDNLSCLPQSKHLLSLYDDVSDVETFSWIERPALQDKPYLMAFFADKSIKELEAMFRQEPNIEAPSNSKK